MPFKAYDKPKLSYLIACFNRCLPSSYACFFVLKLPPCSKNLKTSLSSKNALCKAGRYKFNLHNLLWMHNFSFARKCKWHYIQRALSRFKWQVLYVSLGKNSINVVELIYENLIMDTVYSRLFHFLKQFLDQEWSSFQVPLHYIT